ncbi:hypothetical protein KIH74_28595 [Kineosporia sp. J2-2]|uniref:Uncharacterized protein n=1 Tax=Kineosporia corallincola TaxID=2835133 RepID=A0ABS5TPA9_9ACTN|nr:hypothetical protein [Kineosporia corallincola]MBT0772936.1 hypothetical protein [Kineosporia corallincola]
MSVPRGFAARDGLYGAGIRYRRPQHLASSDGRHYDAEVQKLLTSLVEEIERQTLLTTDRHEPTAPTEADIDAAFGVAILSRMMNRQLPAFSRLESLFRPVLKVRYRLPETWAPSVVTYFEDRTAELIGRWATETDRLLLDDRSLDPGQAIENALYAVISVLRVRAAQQATPPAAADIETADTKPITWTQRFLTGFRIRIFWAWLRSSLRRLCGAILITMGGVGGLWTAVQKELLDEGIDGPGPWALALVVVGAVVMLAGGRSAD